MALVNYGSTCCKSLKLVSTNSYRKFRHVRSKNYQIFAIAGRIGLFFWMCSGNMVFLEIFKLVLLVDRVCYFLISATS